MVTPIPEANLTSYEKEFLTLFGSFYEKRGMPKMLGKLIGLLILKAPSPEKGLDQQEIADYIQRSVSNTSRMLKVLEKTQMCRYIDVKNERSRRERKYFMSTNFGEALKSTLKRYVIENQKFFEEIVQLCSRIKPEETEQNTDLIHYSGEVLPNIQKMKSFWKKMVEVLEEQFP